MGRARMLRRGEMAFFFFIGLIQQDPRVLHGVWKGHLEERMGCI